MYPEGKCHEPLGLEQASKLRRVCCSLWRYRGGEIYRAAYAFWHADEQFLEFAEASVPLSAVLGPRGNAALVASGRISHVRHHRIAGTAQSGNPASISNVSGVARARNDKSQREMLAAPQMGG